MSSPIFVDANVPIYAVGRPHPLKAPCADVLQLIAHHPEAFVTDAEVLQELLHRYLALNLWSQGRPVFENFAALMQGRIESILADDALRAGAEANNQPGLSARDLLHLAVMRRLGAERIVSADRGFDRVPHLQRLDPADLPRWQAALAAT